MVTFVGTQENFATAVKKLVELNLDAIEAYKAAIERLDNQEYKNKLSEFKTDHERHVRDLSSLLNIHGESAPTEPSAKHWLTEGKVALANLVGDNAILMAMRSNEIDTNTAHERVRDHTHKWKDAEELLNRAVEDEHKHKEWLNQALLDIAA
jgi:rubrerythrin